MLYLSGLQVLTNQVGLCFRMCELCAFMVPFVNVRSGDTREHKCISTLKANIVFDVERQLDRLMTFIGYLHRVYEKRHEVVLPGKSVEDQAFAKNLARCLTPLEDAFHLTVFDKVPLAVWCHETMSHATQWVHDIKKLWDNDLQLLVDRVKAGCPDWLPKKDELVKPVQDPMVRILLLNPEYKYLADLCAKILEITAAERFSRATVFSRDSGKAADAVAKLGNLTVTVTWILFNWWVALPKLKGFKLKAGAAAKLKTQLMAKFMYVHLPEPMQKALNETIDQCIDARSAAQEVAIVLSENA
jgi:hypothetical protein